VCVHTSCLASCCCVCCCCICYRGCMFDRCADQQAVRPSAPPSTAALRHFAARPRAVASTAGASGGTAERLRHAQVGGRLTPTPAVGATTTTTGSACWRQTCVRAASPPFPQWQRAGVLTSGSLSHSASLERWLCWWRRMHGKGGARSL
jgi:hypothetical protein